MTYDAHPIANLFPVMTSEDFERLAGDIKMNGLHEPIWLFDGKILDGRHRYRACGEEGVPRRYEEFKGDEDEALAFVLSINLARRHMTTEQRAIMGAKLKQFEKQRSKERMSQGGQGVESLPPLQTGKSRDIAGAQVGVCGKTVDEAEKLMEAAPDVAKRMERGQYGSMSNAKKAARLKPEVRDEVHERMDMGSDFKSALNEAKGEPEGDINNTPVEWIELARSVMGGIDLDPATNADAQEVVHAIHFFTREDDGLNQEWFGRVWCNPPYSNGLIGKFTDKILSEWESGRVEAMVVLTNASACSTWWHKLAASSTRVGFPKSRINFWRGHAEQGNSNNYDQSLFYFGSSAGDFDRAMADAGHLPVQVMRGAR